MKNRSYPISVVMSVYNGEKYLREAIDSILSQTFQDFEFIIIDDGSTDNSPEIVISYNDPKIIFIQQENRGLATALNLGINKAKGKFIARMDADDISMPERLKIQFDFFLTHQKCVVVGTNAKVIDMNGEYLYTSLEPIDWKDIQNVLPKSPFFHSSAMFRKEIARKCGGYLDSMLTAQDCLLFNLMAEYGELRNISNALIKYRLVPTGISMRSNSDSRKIMEIVNNVMEFGKMAKNDLLVMKKIYNKRKFFKESYYYLKIGKVYIERNFHRKKASKNLILAILNYPLNVKSWFNLILLFLPKFIIRKWKKYRGVYCQF